MRVFAVSDLHIDHEANARWVAAISAADHRDDVLIVAGDVSDTLARLEWCLGLLVKRFKNVLFVPGNHELWVLREDPGKNSFRKLDEVRAAVESSGASMAPLRRGRLQIVPLLSWYDYSFGQPSGELRSIWMDYRACRWPSGMREKEVTAHFAALNASHEACGGDTVVTFSHFLPRIDLMPEFVPSRARLLYPVLGASLLEEQLRQLGSRIHVYGHSHLRCRATIDGVSYVNNAIGYPSEWWVASKTLRCIHEC